MDATRIFARKVILSIDVAVFATLLMLKQHIHGQHWLWAMTVTALSFIAAETIQKRTRGKQEKRKFSSWLDVLKQFFIDLWWRISAIFTLDFLVAFVIINLTHYFSFRDIIEPTIWFPLVSSICGFYNVGNALSKDPNHKPRQ